MNTQNPTIVNHSMVNLSGLDIRPISRADIPECARLLIKAYNLPPWRYSWEQEMAEQYLMEYMDCRQFIGFSLFDGPERMGAVFAHTKTWWTENQLFIDELFISSTRQRSGYGQALLDHAAAWGKTHGFPIVVLMTNKFMPALKFYNKNRFLQAEQFVFLVRQG